MSEEDLLDRLIDRIAEAVVRKIDERRKIDLIAEAVLARMEGQGLGGGQKETVEEAEAGPLADKSPKRRGPKASVRTSGKK
jgi:hypothetical protein